MTPPKIGPFVHTSELHDAAAANPKILASGLAQGVLSKLVNLGASKGYCYRNIRDMAREMGKDPKSVRRVLDLLEAEGFIIRERGENTQVGKFILPLIRGGQTSTNWGHERPQASPQTGGIQVPNWGHTGPPTGGMGAPPCEPVKRTGIEPVRNESPPPIVTDHGVKPSAIAPGRSKVRTEEEKRAEREGQSRAMLEIEAWAEYQARCRGEGRQPDPAEFRAEFDREHPAPERPTPAPSPPPPVPAQPPPPATVALDKNQAITLDWFMAAVLAKGDHDQVKALVNRGGMRLAYALDGHDKWFPGLRQLTWDCQEFPQHHQAVNDLVVAALAEGGRKAGRRLMKAVRKIVPRVDRSAGPRPLAPAQSWTFQQTGGQAS